MSSLLTHVQTGQRALFVHIPKTGGTAIEGAFDDHAAFECRRVSSPEVSRHGLPQHYSHVDRSFSFSIVRHPLTWYESWYRYQTAHEWPDWDSTRWHPWRPLVECRGDTFAAAMSELLVREPGWVTRMYEAYVGPPNWQWADHVFVYEDGLDGIADCVAELLGHDGPIEVTKMNVTRGPQVEWDASLRSRVLDLEAPAIRRWWP